MEAGIDDVQFAILEPSVIEAYAGSRVDGLPDIRQQLELVHQRLIPAI